MLTTEHFYFTLCFGSHFATCKSLFSRYWLRISVTTFWSTFFVWGDGWWRHRKTNNMYVWNTVSNVKQWPGHSARTNVHTRANRGCLGAAKMHQFIKVLPWKKT